MFTEKVGRLLLDLHFTRTFKKSSKSGDFAECIYIGPNNPKKYSSPGFNGNEDDYTREPQDLADAAARANDWGYDKTQSAGITGALIDTANKEVDIHLVRGSRKIMDLYKNKKTDTFTKNSTSKETFERAKKIDKLFTLLATRKIIGNNPLIFGNIFFTSLSAEQLKLYNKMSDIISLTIDDMLSPVDGNGKEFKP
jgi:hypothetical protein